MKKANKIPDMIKVFTPFPLMEKSEFDEFYVDTYEARGYNAVKRIAYGLQYNQNSYMKILFTGHRGSGKSTELFLLSREIRDRFEVVNFFIEEEVDVDTMTAIDFIFAVMAQVIKYIDNNDHIHIDECDIDALHKYWYEEKIIETSSYSSGSGEGGVKGKLSFLKSVALEGGVTLKTGSESKVTIRQKVEPKIGYLIQLINQLIAKVNRQLGSKDLVFIVEDLDKLTMDVANELFIKNRKLVLGIKAKMILTCPIFMVYDSHYNMIKEDVDMSQMLSIIKVKDQNKEKFPKGVEKLKEIVFKRAEKELFDEDALEFMVMKSGGAIRDLFQMIKDAALETLMDGKDKITMQEAKSAYRILKSEYERLIRTQEDVRSLSQIYKQPKPLVTDESMMTLMLRGLVLEYNGERWCDWCGIHSTIEDFLKEKGLIS